MTKLSKQQILELPKYCSNLKIGGSCWVNCPYRENGRCELETNEVLTAAISYLKDQSNNTNKEVVEK
ncbi:hypothetical protein [Lacrimispora amygdalina]|uniref:hypothetical protein n=1 Tax=Lacrimispora amygdalina TaxID=253257 RepID=UPI000BE2747C|nr:hypothetical protein [Lacrimispora amygdalina]